MKNKKPILALILLLPFALFAQKSSLSQPMFKDLKLTNSITKSYRDSTCVFHVAVIDENMGTDISKRYFWFHQGELRSTQGNFTGKLLHGTYEKFDREGKLLEKGDFDNGLKIGQWLSWYPNGNIMRHVNWSNGVRDGRLAMYDPQGNKSVAGRYRRGVLHGNVYYFQNGVELRKEKYSNGKLLKAKENNKEGKSKNRTQKRKLRKRPKTKADTVAVPPTRGSTNRKAKRSPEPDREQTQPPADINTFINPPAQPVEPAPQKSTPRSRKKKRNEKNAPLDQ